MKKSLEARVPSKFSMLSTPSSTKRGTLAWKPIVPSTLAIITSNIRATSHQMPSASVSKRFPNPFHLVCHSHVFRSLNKHINRATTFPPSRSKTRISRRSPVSLSSAMCPAIPSIQTARLDTTTNLPPPPSLSFLASSSSLLSSHLFSYNSPNSSNNFLFLLLSHPGSIWFPLLQHPNSAPEHVGVHYTAPTHTQPNPTDRLTTTTITATTTVTNQPTTTTFLTRLEKTI